MIICAGESLIDMVSFRGEAEYTPHVGGSNFNSSIALGRLGADSYYFGAISNDSYGELIENTLRHSKVKEDFVIKTNRQQHLPMLMSSKALQSTPLLTNIQLEDY